MSEYEAKISRITNDLDDMRRGPVAKVWDKVQDLWAFIKDPDAPKLGKAMAIGALIYLVVPIDAVPDFIPFGGLLDDVGVIMSVVAKLAHDLYEQEQRRLEAIRQRQARMRNTLILGGATLLLAAGVVVVIVIVL